MINKLSIQKRQGSVKGQTLDALKDTHQTHFSKKKNI